MHVLTSLGVAGLQKGVVNLANRLDRRRFRTSICCLEERGIFEDRLLPGTEVFTMHRPARVMKRLPLRLARLFAARRVDVVHTHCFNTLFYGGLACLLCPRAALVHGEHGELYRQVDRRDLAIWRRLLAARAYAVYALTRDIGRLLLRLTRIPRHKVIYLPNGVELDVYRPGDGRSVREALGFSQRDVLVAALGRLVPVKNYPMLLKGLAAACRTVPRLGLVFIGGGPEDERLQGLARGLGIASRVKFLGDRDDVPDLLRAADTVAMTSLSEGMSNTLLEAMATGLPTIATAVGGNPELVVHERTGLVIPSRDDRALRDALVCLGRDAALRKRLGRAGRTRAERKFPVEKMIRRYAILYDAAHRRQPVGETARRIRVSRVTV